MLPALFLVVTGRGNRLSRATVNALAAGPISKKKAIGPVVGIWSKRLFDVNLGHYRSDPHGFAPGGDESVA